MENNDEYNVDNFTDEELFHLMDLNNPTDRELEAKLYLLIEKYEGNKNKLSVKMCKFFNDVFSHFFSTDDENEQGFEGFETQYKNDGNEIQKKIPTAPTAPVTTVSSNYSRGLLNPLLKESIKRIVCVDSQYRDLSVYPNPSNFTFNLSDTLTDVVSLKLYSIQIPYTWYTISNDFGSNFFIIKGNEEGIDNGNFDLKVEIQSGNYQSNDFKEYLNNSLQKLFIEYSDFDFGSTAVSYNSVNAKMTLTLDIKIIYNENSYELEFFDSSSNLLGNSNTPLVLSNSTLNDLDPSNNSFDLSNKIIAKTENVISSIPELLGYKYNKYSSFSLQSNIHTDISFNATRTIGENNKFFNIHIYEGVIVDDLITYSDTPLKIIKIELSIYGPNTMVNIVADIKKQLRSSPFIDPVYSTFYFDRRDNRFKFKIRLNRKKVINGKDYKVAVILPYVKFWTTRYGLDVSAFKFEYALNELNQIESETDNLRTQYVIPGIITDSDDVVTTLGSSPKLSFVYKNVIYQYRNHSVDISSGDYTSLTIQKEINDKLKAFKLSTSDNFDCSLNINTLNIPSISCNINETIPYYNSSTLTKNFTINITKSFFGDKLLKFEVSTLNANPSSSTVQSFISYFTLGASSITIQPRDNVESDFIRISMKKPDGTSAFTNMRFYVLEPGIYNLENFQREINIFFNKEQDNINNVSFKGSSISIIPFGTGYQCTLILNITVVLRNKDFDLQLIDTNSNIWYDFFGFRGQVYTNGIPQYDSLGNRIEYIEYIDPPTGIQVYDLSKNPVIGTFPIPSNLLLLTTNNNSFSFIPIYDTNGGVFTSSKKHKITITLTLELGKYYTRENIVTNINSVLSNNEITYGSYVSQELGKTIFRVNINKKFTAQDFRITFFDNTFTRCNFGSSTIDNVKWDTTLGWILGFRNQTQYILSKYNERNLITGSSTYYTDYSNQPYTVDLSTDIVTLTGDTSINVNLYNYLLVVLDDYCQNHLNDGLVTVTKTDYDIPLPSYANRTTYQCDASGQLSIVDGKLTTKQLYSANQILNTKQINQKQNVYSSGPFTQDIFALVPIKTSGLSPGQSFVDFSGTLQNQERTYFGPVNIRKMTIQLLNDKGSTLDLNGANWSFSFIAEQLYNPSRN
jgi:hypothetical protein